VTVPDRQPLFTAQPLPRADVKDEIPAESDHPQSLTGRIRRFLLNDGEALFRAEQRQAEYHQKLEETDPQPRN
jgi:hypothetical protein